MPEIPRPWDIYHGKLPTCSRTGLKKKAVCALGDRTGDTGMSKPSGAQMTITSPRSPTQT